MKCSIPFCRKQRAKGRTICHCHFMREFRARHPLRAIYIVHKQNARGRGVEVLWDYDEFKTWAEAYGFLEMRQTHCIHRRGDVGPYCADNCLPLPKEKNAHLGYIRGRGKFNLANRLERQLLSESQ